MANRSVEEQMDKCTEQYTLRIPEITKIELDRLPPALKAQLRERLLITMARIIHKGKFDAMIYLKSD